VVNILLRAPDMALGTLGPLVIAVTDGPQAFAPDTLTRSMAELSRLRRTSHKDRFVYVYLAGERSQVPDQAAREKAAPITELFDECVGIHEGSGFRGSLVRAVVTSIGLLTPRRVRPTIVATIAEASATLAPRTGIADDEISAAIEAVRRAAHG
jgi:hypothetical protein